MSKIGILAYGSLIDDPGRELSPFILEKISCITPFKVEYARKSGTRSFAPTLIPSMEFGKKVNARLLVLNNDLDINEAKSMLWRRETGQIGTEKKYYHTDSPSKNKVQIKTIENFHNIQNVLYTYIGRNIDEEITADRLSDLAIQSILDEAGSRRKDGVRYLLSNNLNGITTEFSSDYEKEILRKINTTTLKEAIEILDKQRENK